MFHIHSAASIEAVERERAIAEKSSFEPLSALYHFGLTLGNPAARPERSEGRTYAKALLLRAAIAAKCGRGKPLHPKRALPAVGDPSPNPGQRQAAGPRLRCLRRSAKGLAP